MYRAIPVGNRLCAKREQDRCAEIHSQKIKAVKCTVDFSEPVSMKFDHLQLNLKREQMLEERYEEIDRHNRILLQKMAGIMRKPPQSAEGGARPRSGRGSLNKPNRIKELHRITKENQGILERIQRVAPTYNHVEWFEDARLQEKRLQYCCEYPLVLRGGGTPRGNTPRDNARKRTPRPEPPREPRETAEEEPGPKSVFKRGMVLADRQFLVEMRVDGARLLISAYTSADGEERTLDLVLAEKEYRRVFREAGGDYAQVAARLDLGPDGLILRPFATAASAPAELLTFDEMAAPTVRNGPRATPP